MAMKTEAARWLVYSAASMIDNGRVDAVTKYAAMAKCFATDTAMEVATDAVQIFGGSGFMEDYPIAKCFRDAKILQIYEGTNQVQRMVIARNLIKEAADLAHLSAYIPSEAQRSYKTGTPDTTGALFNGRETAPCAVDLGRLDLAAISGLDPQPRDGRCGNDASAGASKGQQPGGFRSLTTKSPHDDCVNGVCKPRPNSALASNGNLVTNA
jgi:hypothetical protein